MNEHTIEAIIDSKHNEIKELVCEWMDTENPELAYCIVEKQQEIKALKNSLRKV